MMQELFGINNSFLALDKQVMGTIAPQLVQIEETCAANQLRMLEAFRSSRIAAHHFTGSTGYGYDDAGRSKLEEVFARVCGCEAALYRHQFMSGTHALTVALFGILRPGDTMLCATGRPYDTLIGVLGIEGTAGHGSLAEFGIGYKQLELANGKADLAAIAQHAPSCKVLYLQRSRGYAHRPPLCLQNIEAAADTAKKANPGIVVMVDNCYGEFTQTSEPTQHGADLVVGSLIKNPGGGIAPTGGYIAGKSALVEACAHRLTAPGIGGEIGCTNDILRQLYLGLYFAPGVTAEALKTGIYASALFHLLGYPTQPAFDTERNDIITSIDMGSAEKLCAFCEAIQSMSPVDSFATPQPWPMPGYDCDIIMAAGAFTQGSSIELSCDGPMRPPFTAYLQGGLNFAASRAAVLLAAQKIVGLVSIDEQARV